MLSLAYASRIGTTLLPRLGRVSLGIHLFARCPQGFLREGAYTLSGIRIAIQMVDHRLSWGWVKTIVSGALLGKEGSYNFFQAHTTVVTKLMRARIPSEPSLNKVILDCDACMRVSSRKFFLTTITEIFFHSLGTLQAGTGLVSNRLPPNT